MVNAIQAGVGMNRKSQTKTAMIPAIDNFRFAMWVTLVYGIVAVASSFSYKMGLFYLPVFRCCRLLSSIFDSGFANEFHAAWLEGGIFTLFVGTVTLVAAREDPRKASFDKRIEFLFNNTAISHGAKNHIKKYLGKFSCYSPAYEFTAEYISHDDQYKFYEVLVTSRRVLINTLKDKEVTADVPLYIYTDQIPGFDGPRAKVINFICEENGIDDDYIKFPVDVYGDKYIDIRSHNIAANQSITVRQKYSILHYDGEKYQCVLHTYTDHVRFIVRNSTDKTLRIKCLVDNIDINIPPAHTKVYDFFERPPTELALFSTLARD